MKNPLHSNRKDRKHSERGQTFLVITIFVVVFLLAMLGVAADYSSVWAHRQMAQGAADAACQAGAADLLLNGIDSGAGGTGGLESFSWIPKTSGGAGFDCSASSGNPPCQYAGFNGYPAASTTSNVHVSFPSSVPGVTALPAAVSVPIPYITVSVTEQVPLTLARLVTTSSNVSISAKASCGLVQVAMPTPIMVLHTTATDSLSVQGNAQITVFGGPQRSIQVNSDATAALTVGTIDLTQGGPADSGSDLGVFGGPTTQPGGVLVGSTGHYLSPALPISDPFANVAVPAVPATVGTAFPVPFRVNGCPDPIGCVEFTPGSFKGCTATGNINPGAEGCLLLPYKGNNPGFKAAGADWVALTPYAQGALIQPTTNNPGGYVFRATVGGTSNKTAPAAWPQTICTPQNDGTCSGSTIVDGTVTWMNVGLVTKTSLNSLTTAIFDPGLYYVGSAGLFFGDNATARVSTATGDGSLGVMFYFSNTGTVGVTSNSGKASACTAASSNNGTPNGCVVSYNINGAVSTQATAYVPSQPLKCPSGSTNPKQVPTILNGNILLGPCGPPTPGVATSTTYGSPDGNRGFLFFQNRANSVTASWGGGGQFLSSGFMYFTSGNGAKCGTGTSCLTLQGVSGSQAYTLGDIVVDELALGGTPNINMILNPTATFSVLQPSLLQ